MNSKIFMILRILLGIFVLTFGANKLYPGGFIPMEAPTGDAATYFGALMSAKTLLLVAIVEVAAGSCRPCTNFQQIWCAIGGYFNERFGKCLIVSCNLRPREHNGGIGITCA